MKHMGRDFFFHMFSVWFASQILPDVLVVGTLPTLALAGFVLTLLVYIVLPMLKILFIPINLITFGLFSWIIHVIMLYLLTLLVPQIQINPWTFPGATFFGFVVPAIHLNYIMALIVVALLITAMSQLIQELSDGK